MTLYFLTRIARDTWTDLPQFFRFHFTDLLFVPCMCLVGLITVRYIKRNPIAVIPWYLVFLQTAIITYYFEYYLPRNCTGLSCYQFDYIDIVMYFLGGFLFLWLQGFDLARSKNTLNKV